MLEQQPRVREARFGDGYVQRAPDGINAQPQGWDLQFNDVDDEIGDEMIAFLRQHAGYLPFSFHPLWEPLPIKVTCSQWRRTLGSQVRTSNITCRFEQDFSPGGFEPGLQGGAKLQGMGASGAGAGGSDASGGATVGGPSASGGLAGNLSALSGGATIDSPAAGGSLQPEGLVGDAPLAGPSASGGMSSESATFAEGYLVMLTFEAFSLGDSAPQLPLNDGVLPDILLAAGNTAANISSDEPLYGTKHLAVGPSATGNFARYPALPGSGNLWQSGASDFGLLATQTMTLGGFAYGGGAAGNVAQLLLYYGLNVAGGFFSIDCYLYTADGFSWSVIVDVKVYSDRGATPTLIESKSLSAPVSGIDSAYRHIELSWGGTSVRLKVQGTELDVETMSNTLVADLSGRLVGLLRGPAGGLMNFEDWFIHRATSPLHAGNFTPGPLP